MAEDTERPTCRCHDEPMLRNGIERRYNTGPTQQWRCAVRAREKSKRIYDSLEHVAWSRRLLQMRAAHQRWANRLKRERLNAEMGGQ